MKFLRTEVAPLNTESSGQLKTKNTELFETMQPGSINTQRIEGYDIARSLAFFGMILVNFWALMEMGVSCPKWLTFILTVIQGRAAAAFVILAGVGLSLLSKGWELNHDPVAVRAHRFRIWRRAFFLFVVGVLNAIIWPADILHFYALYFVVGAVLVSYSSKRLLGLMVTPLLIFTLLMVLFNFDRGMEWGGLSSREWLNPSRVTRHLFFNGHYPFFPWISFLIVGLWLGRQDLFNVRVRRKIVLVGITGIVVSEMLSWIIFYVAESHEYILNLEALLLWAAIDPWEPMPFFMISACGTALIVIIFLVVWTENLKGSRWLRPFVAVGQSTLTLYMLHIVVGKAWLRAMKLWHIDSSLFPLLGGCLFFGLSLCGCFFLKIHFKRGPLEWVMRRFFDTSFFRRVKAF